MADGLSRLPDPLESLEVRGQQSGMSVLQGPLLVLLSKCQGHSQFVPPHSKCCCMHLLTRLLERQRAIELVAHPSASVLTICASIVSLR